MTYDRVWFELAQLKLRSNEDWTVYEMFSRPIDSGGNVFEAPILRSPGFKEVGRILPWTRTECFK